MFTFVPQIYRAGNGRRAAIGLIAGTIMVGLTACGGGNSSSGSAASNGTSAGTFLVRDINSGRPGSYPSQLLNVSGTLRVRDINQSVTFHATRATTMGRPRYHATVVVSPKEYGITRRGTTKPVKVILDATLKRV